VKGIKEISDVEFHYVETADNPADKGTRGLTAAELVVDSLWWDGPSWLVKEREFWPEHIPSVTEADLRNIESELCASVILHGLLIPPVGKQELVGAASLIRIDDFSHL
jgi:hypothetical protein